MTQQVVLYVDAPQHFRIAATLLDALGADVQATVLTPVAPPPWFERAAQVRQLAAPALGNWPRVARTLLRGLWLSRQLSRWARTVAAVRTLVVFNDTGIAQRLLLGIGNRRRWKTVLVQDGLTETQHREGTPAFRWKRRLTAAVLEPLALGHFGTSRYGCAGAAVVLADGPQAGAFFRERAPGAAVAEVGFIRPGAGIEPAGRPSVLFWAVDFLGGLNNRRLHELQLTSIEALAADLAHAAPGLTLKVRLHPGDKLHTDEYVARLGALGNVELDPADAEPFHQGRPLAALSLQSAGVFDTLAARTPSFFLVGDAVALAPGWSPAELLLPLGDCAVVLAELALRPEQAAACWEAQVRALSYRMKIPFDARELRAALS